MKDKWFHQRLIGSKQSWCIAVTLTVFLFNIRDAETADLVWTNVSGGDWNVAANWSPSQVPGPSDRGVITNSGTYAVTVSTSANVADVLLGALNGQQTLSLSGGILTLTGSATVTAGGLVSMVGGTIRGGALVTTNGSSVAFGSGTLDGVTVNGDLNLIGPNPGGVGSICTITNGLVLNGTAWLGNPTNISTYGTINFQGTQTLSGNGTVLLGYSANNGLLLANSGATLSIGPGITIRGQNGQIGLPVDCGSCPIKNVGVVNQGKISADIVGGIVTINAQPFSNSGLLRTPAGTLNLAGSIAVGGLGNIQSTGRLLALSGLLENVGTTLVLSGSTNVLSMQGGTIHGGTVVMTNGNQLVFGSGTFDGLTVNGDLDLMGVAGVANPNVTVTNGLVLNGTARLGNQLDGTTYGLVSFQGTQTLSGNGTVLLGYSANNGLLLASSGATLTLGPGITVHGPNGQIGLLVDCGSCTIKSVGVVNQGTISADVAGGTISINAQPFSNVGTAFGTNGGTLTVLGNWSNSGFLGADGGNLNLAGNFATTGLGTLSQIGGIVILSGTLDNTASTLLLDAEVGSWVMNGGTILGGTVVTTNRSSLVFGSGTLDGVTVNGDLNLIGPNPGGIGSTCTITNGLVLNGTAWLGNPTNISTYGIINFQGTQTLSGSGTVVLGYSVNNIMNLPIAGTTLTIGPGVTVRGQNGQLGAVLQCGSCPQNVSLINQGTISADVSGGTIVGTGQSLTSSGNIEASAGATINWNGDILLDGPQSMASQARGIIRVGGNLLGNTRNVSQYTPQGTLAFSAGNHLLETMSLDLGNVANGYLNNFAYGTISLDSGAQVTIVDQSTNSSGQEPECIYVNSLVVPAGSSLNLAGLHLYARQAQIAGSVTSGSISQVPNNGGAITLGSTIPGSIPAVGALDQWTFFGRNGESVTVILDTGGANVLSPYLNYADVRLFDSATNLLAQASNTVAQQAAVITNVKLPADGTYTIQVRAPVNQPASIGNYQITLWDVTPQVAALFLNQPANGRINTPFNVDQWNFSAAAGQQVRFQFINASAPGLAFDLRGPNGWIGFTNSMADSGLVDLPQSGNYTVTAYPTAGQYEIDYAFQLLQTAQTDLAIGASFTGTFAGDDQAQLFKIANPSSQPLHITLQNSGSNNRAELYVGFGFPPTRGTFTQSANAGSGASRGIVLDNAFAGTWYVLVYADYISTPGSFTLTVDSQAVFVTALTPAAGANSGVTTVEIQGAGFRSDAQVQLIGNGLAPFAASNISWISSSRLVVDFNFSSVPTNIYQVAVVQGSSKGSLPFQVTAASAPKFDAQLIVPGGVGLNTVSTFYVQYANTGDTPIVSPLLAVTGSGLGRPMFSLDSAQLSRSFWAASGPSAASDRVTFFASGKIPGILLAGESGRVPIYFLGSSVTPGNLGQFGFSVPPGAHIIGWRIVDVPVSVGGGPPAPPLSFSLLQFLPPSIATSGGGQTQPDQPINWQSLLTNIPSNIPADPWPAIWMNYTNAAGNTMYLYFGMLQQTIDYFYHLGVLDTAINSVDSLTVFQLARADGIHMLRTLASATDGYVPTPGLRLSIDRTFPNTISGRYRLGPLGRGWSHNWEYHLAQATNGNVTISQPGGGFRTFKPDLRGGYSPDLGDHAQLAALAGGMFSLREKGGLLRMFDANGNLSFIEDPNGNRITCGYSGVVLTRLSHSSGQVLNIGYTAQGRVQTVSDPFGRVTSFTYDGSGEHLLSVQYYDGSIFNYQYSLGNGTTREHSLTQIDNPDQTHQYFIYDGQGRLGTMSRDVGSEQISFAYDNAGTVSATDALNNTSSFYFDNLGLLVRMRNPIGNIVQMQRDRMFNLTSVTDPAGRSFQYAYDSLGNVIGITDPLGHTTQFAYEPSFQRLSRLVDANGNPTSYSYDTKGNLLAITDAAGVSESWSYDSAGNPNAWVNRRRSGVQYQFSPTNGFLLAKTFSDGSQGTYGYDARGNLITASNYIGNITLDYYPAIDRLKRITYPAGQWLDYTYDAAGRRTTMTDQLGYQLFYDYDGIGRLRSITNSDNIRLVYYQYDPAGRIGQKTLGNGVYTTYAYDAAGRLASLTNSLPNQTVVSFFNYVYDERGRRIQMDTADGRWTYQYDDLGQLTHAALTSINSQIPNQDLTYVYDALGNRVSTIENGVTTSYTANSLNQYLQVGGTNYMFDPDGNLIRELSPQGTNTFSYNDQNRLVAVGQGTNSWTYLYDALGSRSATIENGVTMRRVIDPIGLGNAVGEYAGSGNLVARYDYGLGLLSQEDASGKVFGYTFDANGSAQALINSAGAVANSYGYGPFGSPTRASRTTVNAFEFGAEYGLITEANGLIQNRARFFAPQRGRFVNEDIIPATYDVGLYGFANNNPINFVDYAGFSPTVHSPQSRGDYLLEFLSKGQGSASRAFNLAWDARHDPEQPENLLNNLPLRDVEHGLFAAHFVVLAGNYLQGLADPYGLGGVANVAGRLIVGSVMFVASPMYSLFKQVTRGRAPEIDGAWYRWKLVDASEGTLSEGLWGSFGALAGIVWSDSVVKTLLPIFGYDPNQKVVLAGFGSRGYVQSGALLPYRIDFENDTNATAPAQQVFVTDRLANTLDWSTFELTELRLGDQYISLPPETQNFETNVPVTFSGVSFMVQLQAGIRLDSGEIFANFRSIDPETDLPPPADIGFLPPENGTGRGQGHVAFLVRAKANLPTGTEIRNVALVDFANGEIIATDQVSPHDPSKGTDSTKEDLITIDASPPTSSVSPLPAVMTTTNFTVNWSGADTGVGVASYDIYASENAAPWTLWQSATTNTAALFVGQLGHAYTFYSIARDYVGNTEKAPSSPEASTTVTTSVSLEVSIAVSELPNGQGNQVAISFTPEAGKNYTVEFRDDLSPGILWQSLPGAPHNSGSVNETNLVNQRFYRVRVE